MKIVIVGSGNIGYFLTEQLVEEEHDVVIIDRNPEILTRCIEAFDAMGVCGNAVSPDVQLEASVDTADLLIAVTSSDEVNLLCCFLAKKLGCKHTIARVRNQEYKQQMRFMRQDLGLSMSINPEESTAREVFGLLQFPSFLNRDSLANGKVELVAIHIREDSPLNGVPLQNISKIAKVKLLVCVVERNGEIIIPGGSFVLQAGDIISVTAAKTDLVALIKNLNIGNHHRIKNVVLLGGGMISAQLAARLSGSGVYVKIIESNSDRCLELSEALPNCLIIHGDPSSSDFLLSEGIDKADAVVTLGDYDEENIVLSMFAAHMGVPKTITKLDRLEYCEMFSNIGSVISPQMVSVNEVIAYVRDMQNFQGGEVLAVHRILEGRVEALEFCASGTTHNLGVPLEKLSIRKGILLACIVHGPKLIVPTGKDSINLSDTVIVISSADQHIHSLNDIFEHSV